MLNFLKKNVFQSKTHLTFRKEIERQFDKSVREVFDDKTNDNSLILGLMVQSAIAYTCQSLKEADFRRSGMSKQETDAIIDEVTNKMLHKYLENY